MRVFLQRFAMKSRKIQLYWNVLTVICRI
jgi:hypothetical protein